MKNTKKKKKKKNTLNGINNRQDIVEEKIRKCESTAVKILQNEIQSAKLL